MRHAGKPLMPGSASLSEWRLPLSECHCEVGACWERWSKQHRFGSVVGVPRFGDVDEVLEWCRESERRVKIPGSAYPVTGCALGCTGPVVGCCYPVSAPDPRVVELSKRLLGGFEVPGPVPGIGLSPLGGGLLSLR